MKKIISVLVAMLMLLTMVPAFAAVAVDPAYPSKAYFNDLSSIADGATMTGSPFSTNVSYPMSYAFSGGQFSFSHTDAAKSGLVYIGYGGSYEYDNYVFGYDVKFSGLTSNSGDLVFSNNPGTQNTVHQDSTQAKLDSGEWVIGEGGQAYDQNGTLKASKTAWCFKKSGDDLSFTTRKADGALINGANGKPAIFFGSAQLEQDTFYTLKVFVDNVNNKYKAIIVNPDGTYQETGIDGTIQNAFYGINKTDSEISSKVNLETTVTLDNLFVSNTIFDLYASAETAVSSNGTIEVNATIPNDASNPALYINGTLVEELALVPTTSFSDYKITAALPEGTTFGNATVELRATRDGVAISDSCTTTLTKTYKSAAFVLDTPNASASALGLRRIVGTTAWMTVPSDNTGVWAISNKGGEFHITSLSPKYTGVVEFSYDFNPTNYINSIRLRMTANINNGYAFTCAGDSGNTAYHYYANGASNGKYVIGKLGAEYKLNDWNTFKVRVDFYNKKYYAYVNDTLAEESTFTVLDETNSTDSTKYTDRIMDAALIINPLQPTDIVYVDNFKLEEYRITSELAAATATVKYASGNSTLYEGTALNAFGVNGFDFATPVAFDAASINAANVKIVNSAGAVVPATFSFANGVISAAYAGATLTTDNYKLVVGKNATVCGSALGAAYEVPFALSAEPSILSPAANETVYGKTMLKLFAPDADKVVFKINDEAVKTFVPEADNEYEFEFAPTVSGTQVFDAYVYSDNDVEIYSTSFKYVGSAQNSISKNKTLYTFEDKVVSSSGISKYTQVNDAEFVTGGGKDGSIAVKYTSNVTDTSSSLNVSNEGISYAVGDSSKDVFRRMVTEFDIKVGENTFVELEMGCGLNGHIRGNTDAEWRYWYADFKGRRDLFNVDGKILGTSVAYSPDKWYSVRQIIDFENLKHSYYIDGELFYEEDITASKFSKNPETTGQTWTNEDWKDEVVMTFKYKIMFHSIDTSLRGTKPATITIDNVRRYDLNELPKVSSITAGGAAVENNVIAAGTDAVVIALDKAYDALTAADIAVTVDGEAVGTVAVTDNKTFTVSGLAGIEAGKKIEIKLADTLLLSTFAASEKVGINLYVGDANKVCLYPLSVETETGAELLAYSKYINGSGSALNTYLIMTEYANDAKTLVAQTNFAPVTIKAGKVGAVSGYLTGIKKAEGCQVMLWNTDFAPILEAGALAQ